MPSIIEMGALVLAGGLRVGVVLDDHGLEREPAYEPKTSADFDFVAQIGATVPAGARTSVTMRADSRAEGGLEVAVATYAATEAWSFRAGLDDVAVGGWDRRAHDVGELLLTPYAASMMPWIHGKGAASAKGLAVIAVVPEIGAVKLQILEDVVVGADAAATFTKVRKQPTAVAEFIGADGMFMPLVQIGAYDLNHSVLGTVGARLSLGSFRAQGDVTVDQRAEPNELGRRVTTTYRAATLGGSYDYKVSQLFTKLAVFDTEQAENRARNRPGVVLDDNARAFELGVRYRVDGEAFVPYVAAVHQSGRFERTKTATTWNFGIVASF